jgi:hypothetical protein
VAAGKLLRHRLAPIQSRQVAFEPKGARLALADGRRYVVRVALPTLSSHSHAQLDLMDAEVFPAARMAGADAAFYEARRRRLGTGCEVGVEPRLFRRRGDALRLLLHPWERSGPRLAIELGAGGPAPTSLVGSLPPQLHAGDILSANIAAPPTGAPRSIRLLPAGPSLPLAVAGQRRHRVWLVTQRFPYPGAAQAIELRAAPGKGPGAYRLELSRWTRTACRQ